jgi:TPP-dependent pyruvate/acetoin dehydrogenase alpha subunit
MKEIEIIKYLEEKGINTKEELEKLLEESEENVEEESLVEESEEEPEPEEEELEEDDVSEEAEPAVALTEDQIRKIASEEARKVLKVKRKTPSKGKIKKNTEPDTNRDKTRKDWFEVLV